MTEEQESQTTGKTCDAEEDARSINLYSEAKKENILWDVHLKPRHRLSERKLVIDEDYLSNKSTEKNIGCGEPEVRMTRALPVADPFVQSDSKEGDCECESLRERVNWKALNVLSGGGVVQDVQAWQENY